MLLFYFRVVVVIGVLSMCHLSSRARTLFFRHISAISSWLVFSFVFLLHDSDIRAEVLRRIRALQSEKLQAKFAGRNIHSGSGQMSRRVVPPRKSAREQAAEEEKAQKAAKSQHASGMYNYCMMSVIQIALGLSLTLLLHCIKCHYDCSWRASDPELSQCNNVLKLLPCSSAQSDRTLYPSYISILLLPLLQ